MADAWFFEVRQGGGEWRRRFQVTLPRDKALHVIRNDIRDRAASLDDREYRLQNFQSGMIIGPECFRFAVSGGAAKARAMTTPRAVTTPAGDWLQAEPGCPRLELADGRIVDVLAYTSTDEVPGRYRVRDERGNVIVVSTDDVLGDVEV